MNSSFQTTELFMLQDKSEDFHETWQFLDRRFEDVGIAGNTISTANDLVHGMSFLCTVYKFMTKVSASIPFV